MSVIKVDTILNRDGSGGPILSGLTTVGIITSNQSIGSTSIYAEEVVAGIVTSVVSIGVTTLYVSGVVDATNLSGDGSAITSLDADNISSGTLANARTTATSTNTVSSIVSRDASGDFAAGTVTADLSGTATNATNITLADESSDTTCFPVFATAATGNQAPKTGTNLTFNSSTGALTATSFVGDLTGDVTGNADTATSATTATNANNINLADESSDTTCFPIFATAATGNQAGKTGTNLTFNSSTGRLAASIVQGNNIEADTNLKVGSATTSNSLYVVGNSASNIHDLGTESSSFALDFSTGNNFAFTIGGNITLNNPTGITTGQSGIIEITQDGTGSRTLAFQSHWNFPDGTAPTITAGAGTTSVLAYFVKDADMIITTSILALG